MAVIIDVSALPASETAYRFEGVRYGAVPLSFFLVETPPGGGPGLHAHPYAEIFVVQAGRGRFTVGEEQIEVGVGQIAIAPAHVPHAFISLGPGPLRLVAMQPTPAMETTWLTE
jgi:quercetin dioxygenase-like cupin family protein